MGENNQEKIATGDFFFYIHESYIINRDSIEDFALALAWVYTKYY